MEQVCVLFFPVGEDIFADNLEEMNEWICDATRVAIFEVPEEGTLEDFLKCEGLYPSSTYVYLRIQPRHLMGD